MICQPLHQTIRVEEVPAGTDCMLRVDAETRQIPQVSSGVMRVGQVVSVPVRRKVCWEALGCSHPHDDDDDDDDVVVVDEEEDIVMVARGYTTVCKCVMV
jgi:hypothetical protein